MITLAGAAAGVVLGMELEAATPSAAPPTMAILRTGLCCDSGSGIAMSGMSMRMAAGGYVLICPGRGCCSGWHLP